MQSTNLVFPVLTPDDAIAIADQGDWSEWIVISHTPTGAPRQSRNSHWAGRGSDYNAIRRYHDYRNFTHAYLENVLNLSEVQSKLSQIEAIFYIPMPKGCYTPKGSLSAEGKRRINQPHRPKPDSDNLLKALVDSVFDSAETNDSQVWDMRGLKFWSVEGSVCFRWK